jgi:hypothetical protein
VRVIACFVTVNYDPGCPGILSRVQRRGCIIHLINIPAKQYQFVTSVSNSIEWCAFKITTAIDNSPPSVLELRRERERSENMPVPYGL